MLSSVIESGQPRAARRPTRTLGLQRLLWLTLLGLLLQTTNFVRAQEANPNGDGPNDGNIMTEEEAKNAKKSRDDMVIKDFTSEELLNSATPMVSIKSIEPQQGPMSGK